MSPRAAAIALVLAELVSVRAADADTEITRRGYVLVRSQLFPVDSDAVLYPFVDVEQRQLFLEGNFDLTIKGARGTLRADTSALGRISPYGCRDDTKLPGCLVFNELYGAYEAIADRLVLIVGRQRPAWGAALSFHPVEPMNPQPDPTDPTFQRLGAWTALAELTGKKYVATVGWFPEVTHSVIGTPSGLAPGLAGGRFAWRPESFDVSGLAYVDLDTGLPLGGVAGSAVLGQTSFEVHGEALVHQRREVKTGTFREGTCPIRNVGIPHRKLLDVSGIAGARWDRGDGTLVNLEYMHNGDGMEGNDFSSVLATIDVLKMQCPMGRIVPDNESLAGRPQAFSSTFLRRNYAILSAVKPTFAADGRLSSFGATATVLVGLDDPAAVVSARLIYTHAERVIIRLGGLTRLATDRSQYGILPFHAMVLLDTQVLF